MITIFKNRRELIFAGCIWLAAFSLTAAESIAWIPLGGYDYISLDTRAIHRPGAGGLVIGESFFISAMYKGGSFSDNPPPAYPEYFNSIDIMAEAHKERHQVLSSFKTESDQPVYGGWATMQAAVLYNYQIISHRQFNLRLGFGASLGDFGIEMKDGSNWPLIPLPYLGIEYTSPVIEAYLSFVTGPNLGITVFPESRIRLTGEAELNNYRDLKDLIYKAALHYRFFSGENSENDFAGISGGVSNSSLGFTTGGSNETYEIQYYSLFTEIDLTLLKISGGYAFNGQERLGSQSPSHSGNGYYISLQAMYQFKGDKNEE